MIEEQLKSLEYSFISNEQKQFVVAFNEAMLKIGYENSGITPYVCLGKYKIEYCKAGLKTKKYIARFYFRDYGIVLRLYFTNIDKHREYIENAPDFIKTPFVNDVGKCKQCDKNGGGIGKKGKCSFKKLYTIENVLYEKCSGENYYFNNYNLDTIPLYIDLIQSFYPDKNKSTLSR
jgi:hypothetical protein